MVSTATFWQTVQPLADARLVLALTVVAGATWLAYTGRIDGQIWLAAVGGVVWWSGNRAARAQPVAAKPTEASAELRSRAL